MGDFDDFLRTQQGPAPATGGFDSFMRSQPLKPAAPSIPDPATAARVTDENARIIAAALTHPSRAVPAPQAPYGLQTTQQKLADPNAPTFQNPRTGRTSVVLPPGEQNFGPMGIVDSPVTGGETFAQGVEQLAGPMSASAPPEAGPSSIVPAQPPPLTPQQKQQTALDTAGGINKVISGGLEASLPVLPGAAAKAPLSALLEVGGGMVTAEAARKLGRKLGLPDEVSDLVGTLAGLGVAGAGEAGRRGAASPEAAKPVGRAIEPPTIEPKFERVSETGPNAPAGGNFDDFMKGQSAKPAEAKPQQPAGRDYTDEQYKAGVKLATESGGPLKTSDLQRGLKLGYGAASRLLEQLKADGHVARVAPQPQGEPNATEREHTVDQQHPQGPEQQTQPAPQPEGKPGATPVSGQNPAPAAAPQPVSKSEYPYAARDSSGRHVQVLGPQVWPGETEPDQANLSVRVNGDDKPVVMPASEVFKPVAPPRPAPPPGTKSSLTKLVDENMRKYGNGNASPAAAAPPLPREPATPPAYGNETSIAVPGEQTKYPARYSVREASDVKPSHNPFSFTPNPAYEHQNDRDYSQAGNAARVVENSAPGTFDPTYSTTESPTAEHGAPVIDQRGNALGGNSRTMTIQRVYGRGGADAAAYKQAVTDKATQSGINPGELARFKNPVLTRELTQPVTNGTAQKAITDFNKTSAAALSPAEQAVTDGRRLSSGTVQEISSRLEDTGEGSTLAQALRGEDGAGVINQLVKDGVITPQEKNGLIDERGHLTPDAKDRIGKALVGRMFETPGQLQATPPELRGKLERVAPQLLRTEGREGWGLTGPVREALSAIADARAHGTKNLDDLARQTSLVKSNGGAREYSPQALAIARTLQSNPTAAARAFRQYANDEVQSREGAQAGFFEPPTQPEAFSAAFEHPEASKSRHVPTPELSTLRSEYYVTGASTKFHARAMHFEQVRLSPEDGKHAVAYVANPSGIEYLSRATGAPHDEGATKFGGLHFSPQDAAKVARLTAIHQTAFRAPLPGLEVLHQAAEQAAASGRSLIVVKDHATMPASTRHTSLLEELDHAAQAALKGGKANDHLGPETARFNDAALARKAARRLAEIGYSPNDSGVLAAEIGVRLMRPGGHKELGLSPAEARSLGAHYVRSLRKEYGHATPRQIAGRVFDALRTRQPRTGAASARPQGGSGTPAGNGAVTPGRASEAGSGLDRNPDLSPGGATATGRAGQSELEAQSPAVLRPGAAAQPSLFGGQTDQQVARESGADRDKLTGQQLTAGFNAPLSPQEQAKNLKKVKQPQTSLFEETPENPQGTLFHRDPERGSAPMLTDLADSLHEFAKGSNHSVVGAFKDAFVRNLSQLEEVSPKAHAAAVRAASSRAQAAVILRGAVPKIQEALEGSGISWQEFRQSLMESRLRGIRDRWSEYARQAGRMKDLDAPKAFENGLGDLLGNIQNKRGFPQKLQQTAASLLENQRPNLLNPKGGPQYAALRELLEQTFRDAAAHVATVMDSKRFDHIQQHPGAQEALRVYKSLVEKPMATNHALNEGIFSNALGPMKTYYPLIPVEGEAAKAFGKRNPYKKPGNIANRFATGLAENYDPSMQPFADRLGTAIRANDKAALLQTLADEGLTHTLPPGGRGDTFLRDRVEEPGERVEVKPARQVIRDGKSTFHPAENAVLPRWLHQELKPILEGQRPGENLAKRVIGKLNSFAISGPADLVWHTRNLLGTLVSNTPYLGESLGDKLASAPFVKRFTAVVKTMQVDPTAEDAIRDLQDMAQVGVLPSSYSSQTFSKRAAEELGSERVRFTLSPLLFGPKGLDVRARVFMWRLAKEINPAASPKQLAEFTNQLSIRVPELQSGVERALKSWGLGPFATAGTQSIRNGLHAWAGTGPMPKGGAGQRAWQQFTGGGAAMIAIWALVHHQMTGKWPWQDVRARFMKVPVPAGLRHTALGNGLWGKGSDTGYVDLNWFNPMVGRGARSMGIPGAIDTKIAKGSGGQALEAAARDVLNSFDQPALGPVPRAVFAGVTGKEPYLVHDPDHPGLNFMPAVHKEGAGPRAVAALKEMNSFYGQLLEGVGLDAAQHGHDQGSTWLKLLANLAFPGLVGNPSNPYRRVESLRKERLREAK